MIKSDLVKKLHQRYPNLYLKDIMLAVEIVLQEVATALGRGDRVEIRGFGTFTTRQRKARMARNPRTKEKVSLGERRAVYFRAGKELRDRLNTSSGQS